MSGDRLREWLSNGTTVVDDDDTVSEVGQAPSEYDVLDESRYVVGDFEDKQLDAAVRADADKVEMALAEVAKATQRSVVCDMYRKYLKGRSHGHADYSRPSLSPQPMFQVEQFITVNSLDETNLFDLLKDGPLVARVGAETGLGKTMKLPGMIASKCGLRVLQLELDANVASAAQEFQMKSYGIPGSPKYWSRQKSAFIGCMSYDEFRGVVCSGGRERLFADFDVVYMDEAHAPYASVWAAKQYFAKYHQPHNSLLVVSATVSTQDDNNQAASRVGRFEVLETSKSLRELIEDPDSPLTLKWTRDRTMVMVESDEAAAMARSYYEQEGAAVMSLDSASLRADVAAVVRAFAVPTSVTPRVLVATEHFGTGYNLPVSYMVITGRRRVYVLDDHNALVEQDVPLMEKEVVQQKGRTGRGLATGSGGVVLNAEVAPNRELLVSELVSAYLSLVAAGIRPKPGLFDKVIEVLPRGINRDVARLILRINLPPELVMRYLGSDGLIARKYFKAVELYAQQGFIMRASKDEEPVGFGSWVTEAVGNYYEGDTSDTDVGLRVPFRSPAGLKIVMHTISAVAEGLLSIERWDASYGEDSSDDDLTGVRKKVVTRRRVVAKPRVPEVAEPPAITVATRVDPWAYDADPAKAKTWKKRQALSWEANGDGREAILTLIRSVSAGDLGVDKSAAVVESAEHAGKVAVGLPAGPDEKISIDSPGGGRILLVDQHAFEKLVGGEPLDTEQFCDMVRAIYEVKAIKRFVSSTVFDNWSPAWLSWFKSYMSPTTVERFKSMGLHRPAIQIMGFLYDRFKAEVLSVACTSRMYQDKLGSFFRKTPSLTKFGKMVRKGNLPVGQSDMFVSRVLDIKDAHDTAVLSIEGSGLYAPHAVAEAQKKLPIRDRYRKMPIIDERTVAPPVKDRRAYDEANTRWRV